MRLAPRVTRDLDTSSEGGYKAGVRDTVLEVATVLEDVEALEHGRRTRRVPFHHLVH